MSTCLLVDDLAVDSIKGLLQLFSSHLASGYNRVPELDSFFDRFSIFLANAIGLYINSMHTLLLYNVGCTSKSISPMAIRCLIQLYRRSELALGACFGVARSYRDG